MMYPRKASEWVRVYPKYPKAVVCIQVPKSENIWPKNQSLKFGYLKETKVRVNGVRNNFTACFIIIIEVDYIHQTWECIEISG